MTRAFDDVAIGDELPERRRIVTLEDVKAYADIGGDDNPLHQDEAIARARGFDDVIAHGMFTMGHLATCVVAWAGDDAEIRAISAQFRATVSMGQEIVAGGSVRAFDASERDGATEWPIKRGEATVRLT